MDQVQVFLKSCFVEANSTLGAVRVLIFRTRAHQLVAFRTPPVDADALKAVHHMRTFGDKSQAMCEVLQ